MVRRPALVFAILLGLGPLRAEDGKSSAIPKAPPPAVGSAAVSAKPSAPKVSLSRVAVVGASVSAGIGGSVPLHALLEHAMRAKHDEILAATDKFMGVNTIDSGEFQFDQVVEYAPSLVIAVDFLFWYAHTIVVRGENEVEERRKMLDRGLEQIARVTCPVVLGDIPDMSGAQFKTLTANRMPSPEVLAALNQHVREWAKQHRNVSIVPLDAWVKKLRSGEWVLAGSLDGKSKTTVLTREEAFVADKLHPSTLGALALGDVLIALLREQYAIPRTSLDLDVWNAYAKLLATRQQGR